MQLHTNTVASNSVRETTENGRTYLVAEDVTLGRPLYLDGGYVPETAWRESADKWDGQPGPIGHPTDANGNVVSAQLDAVQQHAVIADIRDTYYSEDDDGLNGDIWVDCEKAEQLGGLAADVPELLRNGNPLEVSTAYYSDPAPPGEYDGEYRENVRENLRPDHVALLPGPLGPGRCSRQDGCGVPPTGGTADGSVGMEDTDASPGAVAANGVTFATNANADSGAGAGLVVSEQAADGDLQTVDAGMQANVLSDARTPSYSGTESRSWGGVEKTFDNFLNAVSDPPDDATGVEDLNQSQRREMAETSLLGDADGDSFDEVVFFPVVNPSTGSINEGALDAVIGGRGSSADISQSAIDSAQSTARRLLTEEFDRDLDSNDTMQSNQTEGDRVRWQSSNGNWRYGIVADEAESSEQVADDEVLIAVYVNEEDGWTRADEMVTVEEDNLEVIDQFPAEAMSGNAPGFDPSDIPNVNGDSKSFFSGMFSAFAEFVNGEQSANGAVGKSRVAETSDEDPRPDVAETDGGHSTDESGCGCGGECSECSDTHTHTQTGDEDAENEAATGTETEPETAGSADTTTNTTMSFDDSDYERLAENSAWDEDELRANDAVAEKVAETVDAQDDEQNDGQNEGDGDADNGGDSPDPEAEEDDPEGESDTDGDGDATAPLADEVRELKSTVEQQNEVIQQLQSERKEKREAQRSEKKEAILANSEMFTETMLDAMDDDGLDEAFERVAPHANQSPTGTDFGALSQPSAQAHMNTDPAANSEDDDDVGPASSGSFADYLNEEAD